MSSGAALAVAVFMVLTFVVFVLLSRRPRSVSQRGSVKTVRALLVMTQQPLHNTQQLLQEIVKDQIANGYKMSSDFVATSRVGDFNDKASVYAIIRLAFAAFGEDVVERTNVKSFRASDGNDGRYFILLDRLAGESASPNEDGSSKMAETIGRADLAPGDRLLEAAKAGNASEVQLCIRNGANPNLTDSSQHWTALMHALDQGHTSVARVLLEAGADVNTQADTGTTALMIAAVKEDTEGVRLLLRGGADRAIREMNGRTALDQVDVIRKLLGVSGGGGSLEPIRELLTQDSGDAVVEATAVASTSGQQDDMEALKKN